MKSNIRFSAHWHSLRDDVINASHLDQVHLYTPDIFLRATIISFKFMSLFTNKSPEHAPL